MVQLVIGLAFIAGMLNVWGKMSKTDDLKNKMWWAVEIILVVIIIAAVIHANN